jgi:hypothetical protein
MEQRPSNQEIDLLKLLAKTYSIVRKNIVLVIVCPALGLLLSLLYVQSSDKPPVSSSHVTQANFLISSDLLSENEANFLCNDLVSSDSFPGFSKEQKSGITNLTYEVKKEQARDRVLIFIKLSATVQNAQLSELLQKAIAIYFNESEPVSKHRFLKEKLYKAMIEKIDLEMEGLEEIKKGKNIKHPTISYDPYSQSVNLYERKINFQNALETNAISVLKKFSNSQTSSETQRKSKSLYLVLGFLGGIVIAVIILFLKFFSAYYRQFEKENN